MNYLGTTPMSLTLVFPSDAIKSTIICARMDGVIGMYLKRVLSPGSSFCFVGGQSWHDPRFVDLVDNRDGGFSGGSLFTAAKKRSKLPRWFAIRKSMDRK